MRGTSEFLETYVLEKEQSHEDLPKYLREVILPDCEIESVAITYKAKGSIMRFRVVQKGDAYGK